MGETGIMGADVFVALRELLEAIPSDVAVPVPITRRLRIRLESGRTCFAVRNSSVPEALLFRGYLGNGGDEGRTLGGFAFFVLPAGAVRLMGDGGTDAELVLSVQAEELQVRVFQPIPHLRLEWIAGRMVRAPRRAPPVPRS